jgi:DNA-3-methyladenine glycosylase
MQVRRLRRQRLPQNFFLPSALHVARNLLGARLVKVERGRRLSGIIVETEAYIGERDLGCHASRGGRTARNAVMFGPPGCAYVYFTYGMHWMLNLVTGREGFPAAVLIRALVPDTGLDSMRRRRGRTPLCPGPATICQAFALHGEWNGYNLCAATANLFIEQAFAFPEAGVTKSPRVGLYTVPEPWKSKPWRFRCNPDALSALLSLSAANKAGA